MPAEGSPRVAPGPEDKVYPVNRIASIVAALRDEGIAASHALQSLDLSASDLTSPRTRVSQNDVIQCFHNALRLSADRFFAYRAGLRFHLSSFGIYGFAMLCSTNLSQAGRFALKYHALATPLVTFGLQEKKGAAAWTLVPLPFPRIDAALYRFIVEYFFGNVLSMTKDILGQSFSPREFRVIYRPSLSASEYAHVFGCPVIFEEPENRFVFERSWLRAAPALADPITHSQLVSLCDQLMDELRLRLGTAGEVRRAILHNRARRVSFDEVARRLNMAPRTLRRRLRDEHTSFEKVMNELRTEIAIRYIRDADLSVEDTATLLGFGDAASFRRAFRRWTSTTPTRFRALARPRPLKKRRGGGESTKAWGRDAR
jgi:AraC-like DNA-binding protein